MTPKFIKLILLPVWMLASNLSGFSEDYTFSCWQNGWRKNANDRSADIFGIETNHYGFTLDVADFGNVTFGRIESSKTYQQAVAHKPETMEDWSAADLSIEVEVDGTRFRASTCEAGKSQAVTRLSAVRLWESGRYVQHYDFLGLDFRDSQGNPLGGDARLDLVAWPESLTFNLIISAELNCSKSELRLSLDSELGCWDRQTSFGGPWKAGQERCVSMVCSLASGAAKRSANVAVQTEDGQTIPVQFDEQKNCYIASAKRLQRDWRTGYTDIRDYDDFMISVTESDSLEAIPFLLDVRPPANVTGVCPILCDQEGRPTGIPVQLSKNWHHEQLGSYVMAYTMLPVKENTSYCLRLVYGFYGTLPSASHAQLSLIGYNPRGGNGRWDQLAIGCWGESICFDMDMSLVDVAITDIRMLMGRSGLEGTKWGWTEAGWGGDWLNIREKGQVKFFQNHLKTAYLSQGPCLTDVQHDGFYGANQEVEFSAQIQTLRTDDYCRTFQKLRYTFTRDVSPEKMWLFKLGRTFHYRTPRIAYGNLHGLTREYDVPETMEKGALLLDKVVLPGEAPHWVAFTGAEEVSNENAKPNGYRALIIRSYKVVVGDRTYEQPTISTPVHAANPTNLDIELLPPAEMTQFHKGDRIELDLELITLPRTADDYYGPNEMFRQHLMEHPNSWQTTFREAQGNKLAVTVRGGTEVQNCPLIIRVEEPEVQLTIKGGVGAVPICFEALQSCEGVRLYRIVNGQRVEFDQSVHGNDFWQTDFDVASGTYKITFNLPLDEVDSSQWLLTQS